MVVALAPSKKRGKALLDITSPKNVALLLSFASGVMIYTSFLDLLVGSYESLGTLWANCWVCERNVCFLFDTLQFFVGMGIFAVALYYLPHSHNDKEVRNQDTDDEEEGMDEFGAQAAESLRRRKANILEKQKSPAQSRKLAAVR